MDDKLNFSRENALSTNVYGLLSEKQQAERAIAVDDLLSLEEGKLGLVQAEQVIDDCIIRGVRRLHPEGVWLTPEETLDAVIPAGLDAREELVQLYNKQFEIALRLRIMGGFSLNPGILSPDFKTVEQELEMMLRRQKSIERLHQFLFEESPLASEAQFIKSQITPADSKYKEWSRNTILCRNLIVDVALYPYMDVQLSIEPEDVAAFAALCMNHDVYEARKEAVFDFMENIAREIGISPEDVHAYIEILLGDITSEMVSGEVSIYSLKSSQNFAFPAKVFEPNPQETREEQRQRNEAGILKYSEYKSIYAAIDRLQKAVMKLGESDKEDAKYFRKMKRLSGQLIYFIFYKSLYQDPTNQSLKELRRDIEEITPFSKLIEAHDLADSLNVYVFDDDKPVDEFDTYSRRNISSIIEKVLVERMHKGLLGNISYDKVFAMIPFHVLSAFLQDMKEEELQNETIIQSLINIPDERWIALLHSLKIIGKKIPHDGYTLSLLQGTDSLSQVFQKIPEERQQVIAKELTPKISF